MKLSQHFFLNEFLRSQYAARHGIDMTPPDSVVANLKRLCVEVLEPLREAIGGPLVITSGWRPIELNSAVGGAPNSDHLKGLAADFHALNLDLVATARIVRHRCQTLPIAKCILEFPPNGWVHVSVPPSGSEPIRAMLVADLRNGQTTYSEWVV